MALIQCPECKKRISDTVDSCPNCGYKITPEKIAEVKKQASNNLKVFGVGCLSIVIFFIIIGVMTGTKEDVPKTKEELRAEQIEKYFSPWDGSHRGLTKVIMESINDPDSYEHFETRYWDKGDHLIVNTFFRSKNGFGGFVKTFVKAKVDLNGNVIEVIETQ
ncbi:MAG: zinc ribbon domain-containing protein [Pseudomonadota bacterium]